MRRRCAAVMLGCTETTFYTVAVYFGAAGIKRTRYTIPAALAHGSRQVRLHYARHHPWAILLATALTALAALDP